MPSAIPGPNTDIQVKLGIGLKSQHFEALAQGQAALDFVEIHAENYMVAGGPFHHYLERIAQHYAVSVHGVGLSLAGTDPLDQTHLQALRSLLLRYDPRWFSEHLAWSTHQGVYYNDLLPIAYTTESLQRVCSRIDQVQEFMQRPMLLENPSTYVEFSASDIDEVDFLSEVIQRTGCGLLLDVNNIYVTCTNHGRDPLMYLQGLPLHAAGEIHLAGFTPQTDASGAPLLIDSHASPVDQAVWALYAHSVSMLGYAVPTLIEWDNDIPALEVLLEQAKSAQHYALQALTAPAAVLEHAAV